jgi:hypothetical protein
VGPNGLLYDREWALVDDEGAVSGGLSAQSLVHLQYSDPWTHIEKLGSCFSE